MATVARSAALAGFVAAMLLGGASPVAAECDGPIPSFRDALATADRVVIGDVVGVGTGGLAEPSDGGWSSVFTLEVAYSPVGEGPSRLEIRDVPTQPCAPVMVGRLGDRLAIAFGATDFTPPIEVNTIAWVRGEPPDYPGVETISVAEVFGLLGLDPPDTSTSPPADDGPPSPMALLGLAVIAATAGGALLVGRSRRAGPPTSARR